MIITSNIISIYSSQNPKKAAIILYTHTDKDPATLTKLIKVAGDQTAN